MEFFNGDSPSRFGAVLHKSVVANIEQQAVLLVLKGMEPNGAMGIVCGISAGKQAFGYTHWYGSCSSYSCTHDAIGLFAHVAFSALMPTFGTYPSVVLVRYRHACVEKSNATRSVAG